MIFAQSHPEAQIFVLLAEMALANKNMKIILIAPKIVFKVSIPF
jgi:hypothetical protein